MSATRPRTAKERVREAEVAIASATKLLEAMEKLSGTKQERVAKFIGKLNDEVELARARKEGLEKRGGGQWPR